MRLKPKAIFFDLDGTLVESLPDLAWAIDNMMFALGRPAPGINHASNWVGNGADKLIKRALTNSLVGEPEESLFSYGYNHGENIHQQGADAVIDSFPDLLDLLRLEKPDISV